MSSKKIEKCRARRRRLTWTVAGRRRAWHLFRIHGNDGSKVDCVCELADTWFAKRPVVGCDCRKRKHGAPRCSVGMCDVGDRDRIYAWRREARAWALTIFSGRLELE